jgi:hypothetical protein
MSIRVENSQLVDKEDNPMIGLVQAHIADASVAHALNSTFSDTEAEAALNALGAKVNAILLVLEAHGLVKSA